MVRSPHAVKVLSALRSNVQGTFTHLWYFNIHVSVELFSTSVCSLQPHVAVESSLRKKSQQCATDLDFHTNVELAYPQLCASETHAAVKLLSTPMCYKLPHFCRGIIFNVYSGPLHFGRCLLLSYEDKEMKLNVDPVRISSLCQLFSNRQMCCHMENRYNSASVLKYEFPDKAV